MGKRLSSGACIRGPVTRTPVPSTHEHSQASGS